MCIIAEHEGIVMKIEDFKMACRRGDASSAPRLCEQQGHEQQVCWKFKLISSICERGFENKILWVMGIDVEI